MNYILCAIAITIAVSCCSATNADMIVNISEVGSDVQVDASGSIDLSGLTILAFTTVGASIQPNAFFVAGPDAATGIDIYQSSATGPTTIGFGTTNVLATNGSGDSFGLDFEAPDTFVDIAVPDGFISTDPLSGFSTFSGGTINSLGLNPGTYTWTFGTNTVELNVSAVAVPEPASFLMLGIVGAGYTAIRRRRREAHIGK